VTTAVYTKRVPTNWSVSQVDTFLDCARKHFFKSILRVPDPPNESAARGMAIHKAAENVGERLASGAALDEALDAHASSDAPWMAYVRALAAAGLMPKPGEAHAREHRFTLPTHTEIPFVGVIDLILDERTPIEITDWKSVSDIRYAKTPIELLTNLQLNVYAHYIFQSTDDDTVRTRLAYVEAKKVPLKTKPPRTLNVSIDLTREHARRIWDGEMPFGDQTRDLRLPRILDRMLDIATNCDDPNDVPPTTTTCTKYGGCPYRTQCGLSPFAGMTGARNEPLKRITIQETQTMGFLDKIKNAPTNGTPAPTVVAATAVEPSVPAVAPKTTGFLARAAAAAPATEAARQAKLDADFGAAKVPTGVVPPDAPSRMTAVAPELPQNDVQASEAADAPKKRGRPRKDAEAVEEAAPVKKAGAAKAGFTIMIDCMTTKGAGGVDPTMLDDFFSTIEMELNELAATEENLASYWLLPFAGQKAALAMKVQERIARGLPPVMIVRSSSNAAREVLPFLLPHATQVIQALRG
jgi:hypothetical protein